MLLSTLHESPSCANSISYRRTEAAIVNALPLFTYPTSVPGSISHALKSQIQSSGTELPSPIPFQSGVVLQGGRGDLAIAIDHLLPSSDRA
jgi:hypothetical protein